MRLVLNILRLVLVVAAFAEGWGEDLKASPHAASLGRSSDARTLSRRTLGR